MTTPRFRQAALAAVLLLAAAMARAGTYPVFGPRNFVRDSGQPAAVTESFTLAHPQGTYLLRIVNGGANGALDKVTSATIKVNGTEIAGPSDFNAKTPAVLDKPVTLSTTNQLSVELRGNPGSGLTLSILGEDNAAPVVHATVTPAAVNGWHAAGTTIVVSFTCEDALTGVVSCSLPVTVTQEGANQIITGSGTDGAGNVGTASVTVNVDRNAPVITPATPQQGIQVRTPTITLAGSVSDALSGIRSLTCDGRAATLTGSSFQCAVVLQEGPNSVELHAVDVAGNETQRVHQLTLDTEAPVITLTAPAAGALTNAGSITVSGSVNDAGDVTQLTLNGAAIPLTSGRFTATIPVADGDNTITLSALDGAGNSATKSVTVTRFTVPSITITSPADLAFVAGATTDVRGTVANASSVVVNGVTAAVSGGTFTASAVPLAQGRTVITATASGAASHVATRSILVYRDAIPPHLTVAYPPEGAVLNDATIDVSGTIEDIAVGTINSGQAHVTVGGVAAVVSNRVFMARGVALASGANTIVVAAVDQGGNSVSVSRHVTYQPLTAQARIAVASGDGQSGPIGAALQQPISVRLTNGDGSPASGRSVTFQVVENNGSLTAGAITGRSVTASTNASGIASVSWTLGARAGAGNQVVDATSAGFAGHARFEASGLTGAPALIVVDAGDNQYGVVGDFLPRPLIAVVTDAGSNRIGGVPVTFTVTEGGGSFANGQTTISVTTDSDGRAIVSPRLGSGAGRHAFRGSVAGVTSRASFSATGRVAGPVSETAIAGVVLDNTDAPISGVTVRIDGSSATTLTNANGQFTIPAPAGYVKLFIDGTTAQRTGTWPTLEFAMYTLPGQSNTLGMPIYLLPLDVRRGLFVDEVTGGTLTIPELPGFSLTVAPGSVTFPGGSRTGTVSATLVHNDKMPMPPGFGQQPRFIVTIQPTGAHFDPPAAITFPNVEGLPPGKITELYSFDHDLGQFVAIGTGTVSDDGTQLRSDAGVGIVKAGWHCGGDPAAAGTTADCPDCKKCDGENCVADSGQNGNDCQNTPCKVCTDGNCGCRTSTDPSTLTAGSTSTSETAPSIPLPASAMGLVWAEKVDAQVSARPDNCRWKLVAQSITGLYSVQVDIANAGATEIQAGNTTAATFCAQVADLFSGGEFAKTWYTTPAVDRHEAVHEASMGITLGNAVSEIEAIIEGLDTGCSPGLDAGGAVAKLKSGPQWEVAMRSARAAWRAAILARGNYDHENLTTDAERMVTIPMIRQICATAKATRQDDDPSNDWPNCPICNGIEAGILP